MSSLLADTGRVVLMENHDEAYHVWREAGVRGRTLVHVDAHHDMWWLPENAPITIANFICPAIRQGLVKQIYWVVPDATFEAAEGRRTLARYLRRIGRQFERRRTPITTGDGSISATIGGVIATACTLASLPWPSEPVLLDLDVDFMVIPRVVWGTLDEHTRLPWCWPEDLIARLAARGVRTDLATVAYSVEGGFTPLKWKYLGDELASRLRNRAQDLGALRGFAFMRSAAEAAEAGDEAEAATRWRAAAVLLPNAAACCYRLALLAAKHDDGEAAKAVYRRAACLDASYETPFANRGFPLFGAKRFADATREHLQTLVLDPNSAWAHLGLGQVAAARRDWKEAERLLRRALALDERLIDAHRTLAAALARQGRPEEAIAAYERSLQLGLQGCRPTAGPFLTNTADPRVLDPDHAVVYEHVGRLHQRVGAADRAIQAFEMSIASGNDGVAIRFRLARLCMRAGRRSRCITHLARTVRLVPTEVELLVRRVRRRALRARASLGAMMMGRSKLATEPL